MLVGRRVGEDLGLEDRSLPLADVGTVDARDQPPFDGLDTDDAGVVVVHTGVEGISNADRTPYTALSSVVTDPAPSTTPAPPLADQDTISALSTGDLIDRYAAGVHSLDPRLLHATDEQASTYLRPEAGAGRWSCRALVVHLADSEMVLIHRMRRIACEEKPVLAIWDEDTFIDACVSDGSEGQPPPPVAGAIGTIHSLRLWTRDWLGTLSTEAYERTGLHPERGAVSLRDILEYSAWHIEHHALFLRKKLDLLLGPDHGGA